MKLSTRYAIFVFAAVFAAAAITFSSAPTSAQDDGWQIVRAEYGTRTQHNDVSDIVKDLVGRGGVNGRVAVNNQTMGGDPAVGADKHLRIWARNRRYEEREFDYVEGGFVVVATFTVRRDRGDGNDRPANYGDRDRADGNDRPANYGDRDRGDGNGRPANYGDRDRDDDRGLSLVRAYYGWQGSTVNVTELLRSRMRDGQISFVVTNSAMGGDPAIGADKVLVVIYRYQGTEKAAIVREGYTLTLP